MIKQTEQKKRSTITFLARNGQLSNLAFTALACVVAWLYFYHQTSFVVLRIDDTIVLPERGMFDSKFKWLMHLLFFNQTRYTFAGDFTLVRPILFLSNFIFYEFFMSFDKNDTAIFLASTNTFGFILVFYALHILSGNFKLAIIFSFATFSIVTTDVGYELFGWQHISAYWVGFGLFSLAASLTVKNGMLCWKYASIFILASLSNDCFLAATLIFSAVFFFVQRNSGKHPLTKGAVYTLVLFLCLRFLLSTNKLTWMETNHPPMLDALKIAKVISFVDYLVNEVIIQHSFWFIFCLSALVIALLHQNMEKLFQSRKSCLRSDLDFRPKSKLSSGNNLGLFIWFGSQLTGLCLVLFLGRFSVGGAIALYYFPLIQICALFLIGCLIFFFVNHLCYKFSKWGFYSIACLTAIILVSQIPILFHHFKEYKPESALIVPGKPLKMSLGQYTQPVPILFEQKKNKICSIVKDLKNFSLDEVIETKFGNVDPYSGVLENYPKVISPRVHHLINIKHPNCSSTEFVSFELYKEAPLFDYNILNFEKNVFNNIKVETTAKPKERIDECKKLGFGSHSYIGTHWAKAEEVLLNFFGQTIQEQKSILFNDNRIIVKAGHTRLFNKFLCFNLYNDIFLAIDLVNRDAFVYLVNLNNHTNSEILANSVIHETQEFAIEFKKNGDGVYLVFDQRPVLFLNAINLNESLTLLVESDI